MPVLRCLFFMTDSLKVLLLRPWWRQRFAHSAFQQAWIGWLTPVTCIGALYSPCKPFKYSFCAGVTPQYEQQDWAGTALLGKSTAQLWEEAKPIETAITTTSPWNPVSRPVQPCSAIEQHSSGKAGILFPQHLKPQVVTLGNCTNATSEGVIYGLRATCIHFLINHRKFCTVNPTAERSDSPHSQSLSLSGTLAINTQGKTASVNHTSGAGAISATAKGSGRELPRAAWLMRAPLPCSSNGRREREHTQDCNLLYLIQHPKASQMLLKHSTMFESTICHSMATSQRQHGTERREWHWRINPTAPSCSQPRFS